MKGALDRGDKLGVGGEGICTRSLAQSSRLMYGVIGKERWPIYTAANTLGPAFMARDYGFILTDALHSTSPAAEDKG